MALVATVPETEILANRESDLPVKSKPHIEEVPEIKLWTVEEFEYLLADGLLGADRNYELLNGVIFKKMGQNEPHIISVLLASRALRVAFGPNYTTIAKIPLSLGDRTRPEPDISVLRGDELNYASHAPKASDIALVVEVADTRLDTAKHQKVPLYAAAGIPEYWIVDLKRKVLEVRRGPITESQEWTETRIYSLTENVQPLETTQGSILVNDLFPQIEDETA